MKSKFLFILFALTSVIVYAQNNNDIQRCHANEIHEQHYANDASYRLQFDQDKIVLDELKAQSVFQGRLDCTTPIIIPVAVHYEGVTTQTAACLQQLALNQIASLNADYSGSNSDIMNYCTDIANGLDSASLAYNGACIQFCLANQNHPAGFGLNDGDYAITTNQNYVANNSFPNFTNGVWSGYLNFFVTSGTGLLGYAPLGGSANGDGVVIEACAFGNQGSGCGGIGPGTGCDAVYANYNLGRTISHETGHYLGLTHIWGDGDCSQDDGLTDTPLAGAANYGCPATGSSSCGSIDMTMNFMDYTNDACMYMFSEQQVNVMYNKASMHWTTSTDKCSGTHNYPTPLLANTCNPASSSCSVSISVSANGACTGALPSATATPMGTTAPVTYSWSNNETTATISNLSAGTYIVTITDANNCTATASTNITATSPLTVTITSTANPCQTTGSTSLQAQVSNATGTVSYLWSNNATTAIISNLSPDTYTVTITDGAGCTATASEIITASSNNPIQVTLTATQPSCNSSLGSVNSHVTGGTLPLTYAWNNNATTTLIENLNAGMYIITVTDANGCTATDTTTINNFSAPTVHISTSVNPCITTATATAIPQNMTGNLNYIWSNNQTTATATALQDGNSYSVTVTDEQGCSAVASTVIDISQSNYQVVLNVTDASCGELGYISANALSGIAPYNYLWSNGNNSSAIGQLQAGSYTVTVTDANGCTTSASANISTTPPALQINGTSQMVSCHGASDGQINITINGGTAPYSYNWGNGSTTKDISDLTAGNYPIIVTDANGCQAGTTFTISQPDELTASVSVTHATNGANNGSATANTTGGTAPFTWQWSNSQSGVTVNGLAAGEYSVTVTDANGCTASSSGMVENGTNTFDPAIVTEWKVYPNPSRGVFFLEMQMTQNENVDIQIFNLVGQRVHAQHITNQQIKETIDLSTWNAGTYFMEINVNGTRVVEKLVVVK